MSVMVLDSRNSIIKAKIARRQNGEVTFPHAMKQLTVSEYGKNTNRTGIQNQSVDYLEINGKPYVVGESAERHGLITQRTGAARYTRDYYGVLAAVALGRLYDRSREVSVFGSHPPEDMQFRQDLMEAVVGGWTVEIKGKERQFRMNYANAFDEPVGGLMNVILTEDGQHYQHTDINGGRVLVIDIGGYTTYWLAVNPGGEIDFSLARSNPLGIQRVLADFEESVRSNNLEAVKDTPILRPDRVRKALITGIFEGGGKKYPREQEVEKATSLMLNRIADTCQRIAGGALSWDNIIRTGGGSALLYQKLRPVLNYKNVILADDTSILSTRPILVKKSQF